MFIQVFDARDAKLFELVLGSALLFLLPVVSLYGGAVFVHQVEHLDGLLLWVFCVVGVLTVVVLDVDLVKTGWHHAAFVASAAHPCLICHFVNERTQFFHLPNFRNLGLG